MRLFSNLLSLTLLTTLSLCVACEKSDVSTQTSPVKAAPAVTSVEPGEQVDAAPDHAPKATPPDPLAGLKMPVIEVPEVDPGEVAEAPDAWSGVVLRATYPSTFRYTNLVYEANNPLMRGARRGQGDYEDDGEAIARRWRAYARGVKKIFVLRDSLFSQQDHPYTQDAFWPMLPPNWITAAVIEAGRGDAIDGPSTHDPEDDQAWAKMSREDVFGDFPVSESLFARATVDLKGAGDEALAKARARRARRVLAHMARDVDAMRAAAPFGAAAIARAGAARIAYGDRAYFGEETRREKIIPIFVENPNAKELDEGKGMLPERATLAPEVLSMVTRVTYRARLADGDLAIERYDISSEEERARAIALLEALIPEGETAGGAVWLWITGELDPKKKLEGEDPLAYVAAFRAQLEAADVEMSRLELFAKPTVRLKGDARAQARALEETRAAHEAAGLKYVSVTSGSTSLRNILKRQGH